MRHLPIVAFILIAAVLIILRSSRTKTLDAALIPTSPVLTTKKETSSERALSSTTVHPQSLTEEQRFELYSNHLRYLLRPNPSFDPSQRKSGGYNPYTSSIKDVLSFLQEVFESGDRTIALHLADSFPEDLKWTLRTKFLNGIGDQLEKAEIESFLSLKDISRETGSLIAYAAISSTAKTDPQAAADWVITLPSEYVPTALRIICDRWGRQNQDSGYEALQYLSSLAESIDIDQALAHMAMGWTDKPKLAATTIEAIRTPKFKAFVCERMHFHNKKLRNYEQSMHWLLQMKKHYPTAPAYFKNTLETWLKDSPQAALTYIETHQLHEYVEAKTLADLL